MEIARNEISPAIADLTRVRYFCNVYHEIAVPIVDDVCNRVVNPLGVNDFKSNYFVMPVKALWCSFKQDLDEALLLHLRALSLWIVDMPV